MNVAAVAAKFDLTQDTLRYYEKIGLIPRVERVRAGVNYY